MFAISLLQCCRVKAIAGIDIIMSCVCHVSLKQFAYELTVPLSYIRRVQRWRIRAAYDINIAVAYDPRPTLLP